MALIALLGALIAAGAIIALLKNSKRSEQRRIDQLHIDR